MVFLFVKIYKENHFKDETFLAWIFPRFNKTPFGVTYIPEF